MTDPQAIEPDQQPLVLAQTSIREPRTLSDQLSSESRRLLTIPRLELLPLISTAGPAKRFELFRRYGNFTMAYSTLQPELKYFESHGGYLAYDNYWGTTFVLADPVAPVENHAALIEAFLRQFPRTCFCQISKPVAAILARFGPLRF